MIRIYTSKNCPPCRAIDQLIKDGKFDDEIELVDIESDEGFLKFKSDVLDHSDGEVPSAYRNGQKCQIIVTEDDRLHFECPMTGDPASVASE